MKRALLATVLLLAGCGSTASPDAHHRTPKPTASHTPAPTPSGSPSYAPLAVAKGHGWDSTGLFGTIPAGPCRIWYTPTGEPMPDPSCTPGVIDSAVTDANTKTTVCRPGGYTGTVRPPVSLTEPVKRQLLAAYGIPAGDIGKYELDHLVPLNSGGASDVRNLWPEPNIFKTFKPATAVANDKDVIETYLWQHGICAGKATVSAVQLAMAHDWSTAVAALGLPAVPVEYVSPEPTQAPTPAPAAAPTLAPDAPTPAGPGAPTIAGIRAGEFCKQSQIGESAYNSSGSLLQCGPAGSTHPRWSNA